MNKNDNNWFKLFALMAVAGVAKALFAPAPQRPLTQYVEVAEKFRPDTPEKKDDSDV